MEEQSLFKFGALMENLTMTRAAAAEEAVIFLHVPKTAGTTLNRLIEWEYPLFQMYSVDPVFFTWSASHLRRLPPRRLKKTRMFKGHMLFGLHEILPQPATYITVLRDPIDRVMSAFYFVRSYIVASLVSEIQAREMDPRGFRSDVYQEITFSARFSRELSITYLAQRRFSNRRRRTSLGTLAWSVYPSVLRKVWR